MIVSFFLFFKLIITTSPVNAQITPINHLDFVFQVFLIIIYICFIFFSFPLSRQAVKEFIEIVNKKIDGKTISSSTALKFVLARKLDVPRAVALFEHHVLIRKEEDLDNIEPMSDPLRSELETGKFTILVSYFFVI